MIEVTVRYEVLNKEKELSLEVGEEPSIAAAKAVNLVPDNATVLEIQRNDG